MNTLEDVLGRGEYVLGGDLARFEDSLAAFLDVRYAIGVADGTNALVLALLAAGFGPGAEIILSAYAHVATAAAVHFTGATPVLVECRDDHLMDPDAVRGALTDKTRAVIPVQLNGRTCDMDAIGEIAAENGLLIIEDAAQALGSRFGSQMAGTFGAAGTFSFSPAGLLGCFGDGGAVVTNNDVLAAKVALMRDHGRNPEGEVVGWGTSCRLDNVHAAILNLNLKHLDQDNERRREIAGLYHAGLSGLPPLRLPPGPGKHDPHFDVYRHYEVEAQSRTGLQQYLRSHGIGTMVQFDGRAVHQNPLGFENVNLPRAERVSAKSLLLPLHPALSDEDVAYVTGSIRAFYGET